MTGSGVLQDGPRTRGPVAAGLTVGTSGRPELVVDDRKRSVAGGADPGFEGSHSPQALGVD